MAMAEKLKKYLIGAAIGLLVGLALGVNIGKGNPLFSNPFAERGLGGEVKEKARDVLHDTKKSLRDKLSD